MDVVRDISEDPTAPRPYTYPLSLFSFPIWNVFPSVPNSNFSGWETLDGNKGPFSYPGNGPREGRQVCDKKPGN